MRSIYFKEPQSSTFNLFKDRRTSVIARATKKGDIETIQKMIKKGGRIDTLHYDRSFLGIAARKGHTELVRFFLEKGLDPNYRDSFGKSILMEAVEAAKFKKIFEPLLLILPVADPNIVDYYGKSALDYAGNNYQITRLLINAKGKYGKEIIKEKLENSH